MESLTLKSMPVGFRFRPTDEELINHYLGRKNNGDDKDVSAILEVDVSKLEPWDLPDLSVIESNDNEWFFFCLKDRKYPNKKRSSRATVAGYWKATGRERIIKTSNGMKVIGNKRTLVFYKGRAPNGARTNWGAFSIWKLFKKHDGKPDDENSEPPNCDEIDNSSSAVVEYSAEVEPIIPILGNQPEIQRSSAESLQTENYKRVITDPLSPIGLHNNSCIVDDAENQSLDITSIQLDPELENLLWQYCDPMLEPHHSEIFSSDLGCGYHNNGLDGLELQDDTDSFDINELNLVEFDQLCDSADFCFAPMAPHPTMMTDIYMQDDGNINRPQIIRANLMNRALTPV